MSKFTCLILCAAAVRFSSVYAADASSEDFDTLFEECFKEHGVTKQDVLVVLDTGDMPNMNPCFWGCGFSKVGFLNSEGQYDLNNGLTKLKSMLDNNVYVKIEEIAKLCASVKDKAVGDGEAGCERGALLASCFWEQSKLMKKNKALL